MGRDPIDRAVSKLLGDSLRALYAIIMLRIVVERGPIHGYGIRKLVEEVSRGAARPSESTVYDTLKRLERMGLIESFWGESPLGGPMRKYYRATELGREVLSRLLEELQPILSAILGISPEAGSPWARSGDS
ncbi:MAG: helix-turn-helix transcriptional regulator [Crenarchaeota archaeon]|nr:helix-turn-helix transcriptional regulator [Thermoproteota archaeon]